MSGTQLFYFAIAFLGGAAVPFLAIINASYGQSMGNVYFAALTACAVAFIALGFLIATTGTGIPDMATLKNAQWWHFFAGIFFVIYIVAITFVAPKIGLGNAIIMVVVAQILTSTVIDHFGLLGAAVQHITWQRIAGIAFLCVGVALARA